MGREGVVLLNVGRSGRSNCERGCGMGRVAGRTVMKRHVYRK